MVKFPIHQGILDLVRGQKEDECDILPGIRGQLPLQPWVNKLPPFGAVLALKPFAYHANTDRCRVIAVCVRRIICGMVRKVLLQQFGDLTCFPIPSVSSWHLSTPLAK